MTSLTGGAEPHLGHARRGFSREQQIRRDGRRQPILSHRSPAVGGPDPDRSEASTPSSTSPPLPSSNLQLSGTKLNT